MPDDRDIDAADRARLNAPGELWTELDARNPQTSDRPQIFDIFILVLLVVTLGLVALYR